MGRRPAWAQAAALLATLVAASLALLTTAVGAQPLQDVPTDGWFLQARSLQHADALPLAQLGYDDAAARLAPRAGRNLAYVDDELRVGRRQGAWTTSLLARSSATLVASADSLSLAAALAGPASQAPGGRWQGDARFAAFSGAGAELRRHFGERLAGASSAWQAQAWVQLLSLQRWRERRVAGPVAHDAQGFSFELQSQRLDDRMNFPFQQAVAGSGQGLLFGGRLVLPLPATGLLSGATLEAGVQDLGWLHWQRVPEEQARLSTQTQAVDADGFIVYKPLVQGQASQARATRGLPGRYALALHLPWGPMHQASWRLDTRPGFGVLPGLGWRTQVAPDWAWEARWAWHERRLDLGWQWRGWQLQLGLDRLDRRARSRQLALAWHQGF